jgi:hypothetical protein
VSIRAGDLHNALGLGPIHIQGFTRGAMRDS